jgi:hypothetical protein
LAVERFPWCKADKKNAKRLQFKNTFTFACDETVIENEEKALNIDCTISRHRLEDKQIKTCHPNFPGFKKSAIHQVLVNHLFNIICQE